MNASRPTLAATESGRRRARPTRRIVLSTVGIAASAAAAMIFVGPSATGASVSSADRVALATYISKLDPICEKTRVNIAASIESFEVHDANLAASTKNKLGGRVRIAKPDNVVQFLQINLKYLEEQQVAVKKEKRPKGPYDAQLDKIWKSADAVIARLKVKPIDGAYTDPLRPMAKELQELGFKSCLQPKRPQ